MLRSAEAEREDPCLAEGSICLQTEGLTVAAPQPREVSLLRDVFKQELPRDRPWHEGFLAPGLEAAGGSITRRQQPRADSE